VCRKSGNPAFKGPETLDTALDSLPQKITHTEIGILSLQGGVTISRPTQADHAKDELVQVQQQLKTTTNPTNAHVRRAPTMTQQC
jgi:hypothetical protein